MTAYAIPLESLTPCFQGIVPSWLYTSSLAGVPNASILSHVDYVDSRHVALSFQFFNKSRRNIAENPQAVVRVYDPDTFRAYRLALRFVRSETSGPIFESMHLRIEAIASYTGAKGVFRLIAADIYEVLSVTVTDDEVGAPELQVRRDTAAAVPFTMRALQVFSERLQRAPSLDCMLESILEALDELFGFKHSIILLALERQDRLVTIASRGYPERGVGSEVGFGEGIIGMVAEARRPIRVSGLMRALLYADAVMKRAQAVGLAPDARSVRLPGLAQPQSQLGIPLIARDELIGVLCIESETPYRFHEDDKAYLEVLGGYLAIGIQNALLHEKAEDGDQPEPAATPAASGPEPTATPAARADAAPQPRREIAYYQADECIMVDGEYLVKSLPAKILWKVLSEHADSGRTEFTNRLLRLDKTLALPPVKDNLESRLILLRRRLDERCPDIRIVPSGRGRFMLDLACQPALVARP
ncbi:MAG: GAF domain-containing protein [Myxococcota bacterium]